MNKEPYLVILAAGMGSRYGSLKQIDAVDEFGHALMDYSIYDALEAGFKNIVFYYKKKIDRVQVLKSLLDQELKRWQM